MLMTAKKTSSTFGEFEKRPARDTTFTFRMTADERKIIEAKAKEKGIDAAQFVRAAIGKALSE